MLLVQMQMEVAVAAGLLQAGAAVSGGTGSTLVTQTQYQGSGVFQGQFPVRILRSSAMKLGLQAVGQDAAGCGADHRLT